MAALLGTLAWAGLRRRWQPALLTILVVAVATATATVARSVGGLADAPFERTFAATNGAHVTAIGGPRTDWSALRGAPGVSAASGPLQTAFAPLRAGELRAPVLLRETSGGSAAAVPGETPGGSPAAVPGETPGGSAAVVPGETPGRRVDRELLVAGRAPGAGEVVLERSLARELGLGPGDRVRLGAIAARVSGVAVTSGQEAFPDAQPGLVFAPRALIAAVEPDPRRRGAQLAIRLEDPEAAGAFAARAERLAGGAAMLQTWHKRRADARAATRTNQVVLSFFTLFSLLICGAVVATLVGARVIERARTVATLASIGCTPRQATAAFAAEQVAVGAVGVVGGTVAGTLLAPRFVERSSALLQSVPDAGVQPLAALATGLAALALVAAVATFAAWRAGRGAVVDGLRGTGRGRGRPSRGARLADAIGLPAVAGLAARDALSPPARAALSAVALALTVATVVAVLAMEATLDASQAGAAARAPLPPPAGGAALPAPTGGPALPPLYVAAGSADSAERLRAVVYGLSVALLAVGLANLLATAILSVRERARDAALLRSLGASTRQVAGAVLGAQALAATLATLAGIPLGLLAFRLAYAADNGSASEAAFPPAWQLAALVPAAIAVVVLVCLPAAALANRMRPSAGLRAARE